MIACVQDDDVPAAEVVAVLALSGVAGNVAEVSEVALGSGEVVFVVARHRTCPLFVPAPCGVITPLVLLDRSVFVDIVAGREHDDLAAGVRNDRVKKGSRQVVVLLRARGDIACADQHRVRCRGWVRRRLACGLARRPEGCLCLRRLRFGG